MHSDDIYTKICTRCNEHMTEEWYGKTCMALKLLYLFYVWKQNGFVGMIQNIHES